MEQTYDYSSYGLQFSGECATIYELRDPRDNSLLYIGSTTRLKHRYNQHKFSMRVRKSHSLYEWYHGSSIYPTVMIIEICPIEIRFIREQTNILKKRPKFNVKSAYIESAIYMMKMDNGLPISASGTPQDSVIGSVTDPFAAANKFNTPGASSSHIVIRKTPDQIRNENFEKIKEDGAAYGDY